jgi:hypothetical protein
MSNKLPLDEENSFNSDRKVPVFGKDSIGDKGTTVKENITRTTGSHSHDTKSTSDKRTHQLSIIQHVAQMKMNQQSAKNAFQQYAFILEDPQFSIMMAYFSIKHPNQVLHSAVAALNHEKKDLMYKKIMSYDFLTLVERPDL